MASNPDCHPALAYARSSPAPLAPAPALVPPPSSQRSAPGRHPATPGGPFSTPRHVTTKLQQHRAGGDVLPVAGRSQAVRQLGARTVGPQRRAGRCRTPGPRRSPRPASGRRHCSPPVSEMCCHVAIVADHRGPGGWPQRTPPRTPPGSPGRLEIPRDHTIARTSSANYPHRISPATASEIRPSNPTVSNTDHQKQRSKLLTSLSPADILKAVPGAPRQPA